MIRPAVLLVPDRSGDFFDVDVVAREHVIEERPAVDGLDRLRRRVLEIVAPPLDLLHLRRLRRQAQRQVDARYRGEDVGDDAVAFGKAGHRVEQHRGIAHLAHIDVDDAADLLLRLGAGDDFELARGAHALDPVAQISVGHPTSPSSLVRAKLGISLLKSNRLHKAGVG